MVVSSNMGNWMTYSQWMASTKSTKSPPSGHPWRSRRALRKKNTKLLVHETGKFQVLNFVHILLTATAACCLKILSNFQKFKLFSEWHSCHSAASQASTSNINLRTLPCFQEVKDPHRTTLGWSNFLAIWISRWNLCREGKMETQGSVIYLNIIYHNMIVCM